MCRAWEPTPTHQPAWIGTTQVAPVRGDGGGRAAAGGACLSGYGGLAGCRGRNGGSGGPDGRPGPRTARLASASSGTCTHSAERPCAGVAEVQLDGVGVVGDGTDDALGQVALGQEPLPAVQDLLAGVDAQVAIGEPGGRQRGLGLLGLVGVFQDGDQESLGVEEQRPFTSRRVLVGHARWPGDLVRRHGTVSFCRLTGPRRDQRCGPAPGWHRPTRRRGDAGSCQRQHSYLCWVATGRSWSTGRVVGLGWWRAAGPAAPPTGP